MIFIIFLKSKIHEFLTTTINMIYFPKKFICMKNLNKINRSYKVNHQLIKYLFPNMSKLISALKINLGFKNIFFQN